MHEKNLFLLARKGNEGRENQLTEMLAYLLQEERAVIHAFLAAAQPELPVVEAEWQIETQRTIPAGFLDLVLVCPRALVIVESKLGSFTDYEQIAKYARYARSVPAEHRTIILVTREPEDYPVGVELEAGGQVDLVNLRWWDLAEAAKSHGQRLGNQFADMLEQEGIVKPPAFTDNDWATLNAGAALIRRVGKLLDEAKSQMLGASETAAPATIGSVVYSGGGFVYRLVHFHGVSAGLGFWASAMQPGVPDGVHIVAYALNTSLAEGERAKAGKAFVQRLDEPQVMMSGFSEGYVQRSALAASVLDPESGFEQQLSQAMGFLAESLAYFRTEGYLPAGSVDEAAAADTAKRHNVAAPLDAAAPAR